jgi:HlyD family secretion protein
VSFRKNRETNRPGGVSTPKEMANPKRKSRKKLVFALIAGLALAGLFLPTFLRKKENAITVQTEKVTRRNLIETVVANGRIQPVLQVKISPEVSGEIIELPVKEGQLVKKGDLLLKIKPDFYAASRNSSEASYKGALASQNTAEANLKKAEQEFRRVDELFRNKLVSDSAHDDAKTSFEIAKLQLAGSTHQVEMAQAALRKADEDLSKTTIYSPLTGTVSKLNSQLGERVVGTAMMAGTEVMTVADLNEMEARIDIGEMDVVLIAPNQTARLEVDAFHDKKFTGTVTEIANSSKTGLSSGSQEATKFEVKIRIKEKEAFRPGMSVSCEIETRYRTNVLTVPIASVTTRLPKGADSPDGTNKLAQAKNKKDKTSGSPGLTTASAKADQPTNQTAAVTPGAPSNSATASTNSTAATNTFKAKGAKSGDAPKPVEVVFLMVDGKAKMVPVKRGISDDAYVEIEDGVKENAEVVSGGYKAISQELEDGKTIKVGTVKPEPKKEGS